MTTMTYSDLIDIVGEDRACDTYNQAEDYFFKSYAGLRFEKQFSALDHQGNDVTITYWPINNKTLAFSVASKTGQMIQK